MRVRWTSGAAICGGILREPGVEYDLDEAVAADLIARGACALPAPAERGPAAPTPKGTPTTATTEEE